MSSTVVNSLNYVDYTETSLDQNDLEMEEILNEIGFYADEDFNFGFGREANQPASSDAYVPALFAPVSPDHYSVELSKMDSSSRASPISSFEERQSFSVPNPIPVMSSMPPVPILSTLQVEVPLPSPKPTKKITKKESVNKRKRTFSEKNTLRPSSPASNNSRERDDGDLTEEQLEERRQRNREHAKRSRQRKKSLTCTLQQSLDDLKMENAKLRQEINAMIGADKVDSILESRRNEARRQFIQGLKQASNRILDDSTLSFLKGLQKNIPSTASSVKKTRKS